MKRRKIKRALNPFHDSDLEARFRGYMSFGFIPEELFRFPPRGFLFHLTSVIFTFVFLYIIMNFRNVCKAAAVAVVTVSAADRPEVRSTMLAGYDGGLIVIMFVTEKCIKYLVTIRGFLKIVGKT